MQALNLPAWPFKIVKDKGKFKIFDPIRKKYLILTPEEWVRQHFVRFLIDHRGFPAGLLKLETQVKYHQRTGRSDALFLDRQGQPHVLIECKAPQVAITRETFDQVVRYNAGLHANYLLLTNGLDHFYARVDKERGRVVFLEDLPEYDYL